MIIRRVGVGSCARIVATIYGAWGVIAGVALALATLAGISPAWMAPLVFFLPLVYLVMGYFIGLIGAWVFNKAAAGLGGLEIEVEREGGGES